MEPKKFYIGQLLFLGFFIFNFGIFNKITFAAHTAYLDTNKSCNETPVGEKSLCLVHYTHPDPSLQDIWNITFKIPREIAGNFPPDPNPYSDLALFNNNVPPEWYEAAVFQKGKAIIQNKCLGGYIIAHPVNKLCIKSSTLHGICISADTYGLPYSQTIIPISDCPPLESITSLSVSSEGQQFTATKDNQQINLQIPDGGSYTINWSSGNTDTSCRVTGKMPSDIGNAAESISGKISFSKVSRGIYNHNLICDGIKNAGESSVRGGVERTAIVRVGNIPPAPTVDLKVEPPVIKKGESATLSWTSENAVSLSISQDIGIVRPQGYIKISPSFTTRYTITASGEFSEFGLRRHSVTLRVIAPETPSQTEAPIEVPEEKPAEAPAPEPEKLDLKVNGQDGPLTVAAPGSFALSWNLNKYCLAHGSWLGVKNKAGEERRVEKKSGTYIYKLYCPGSGSDAVTVKVVGGATGVAPAVPFPIAEVSISLDGKNFSKSVRVYRGKKVKVWLSASHDVDGDKKISRDDTGRWTSALSLGGRCEWNYDLNQGEPTFEAATFDPQKPEECTLPLKEIAFYDPPGVYRYGILRLVQNDGKVSNVGYITVAVEEPPPPKTPPIIDLRINNIDGLVVMLGAPANYAVSWDVRNADTCAASGAWNGDQFLSGSQNFVASSKRELTYGLTCHGKLGTTTKSILLKVAELPICDFSALPTVLDKRSVFIRESVLTWKCQFANRCSISPPVNGSVGTFGSVRVSLAVSTKYTLTCQNLEGNSSFDQVVEVR